MLVFDFILILCGFDVALLPDQTALGPTPEPPLIYIFFVCYFMDVKYGLIRIQVSYELDKLIYQNSDLNKNGLSL